MKNEPISETELFAINIMAEIALEMGCGASTDELRNGLKNAIRRTGKGGRKEDFLRPGGKDVIFFSSRGKAGVIVAGLWKLEYESGIPPNPHKVETLQRNHEDGWVAQDSPSGRAAKVFFQRQTDGSVRTCRQIHFSMGKLWDPSIGKAADTGYGEDGSVRWIRSFRDGVPTESAEPWPLKSGGGRGVGEKGAVGGRNREFGS